MTPLINKKQQNKAYLQILIAGCFWGLVGLFIATLQTMGADNGLIGLLRIVSALVFMFLTIIVTTKSFKPFIVNKQVLLVTAVMGIFAQGLQNLTYAIAVNVAGVATSAILLYTAPVFVCIMSAIFFKEAITSIKVVALILNMAGCTLVVTNGNFTVLSFAYIGVIMGVLSGFLYSLVTICGKLATNDAHPLVSIFYAFFFGTIFLTLYTKPWNYTAAQLTFPIVSMGIAYGICCTGIPYIFYMNAISKPINMSIVPVLASTETIIAAITGVLVFSENMGVGKILGIGLVFLSIFVMNFSPKKARTSFMFREMKKNPQLLSAEDIAAVMARGTNGALACIGDEGYPYAVPLSYVYLHDKIYFHCAKAGHKNDAIANNPKVSFLVVDEDTIVGHEYTSYFRSVIAFGKARIIEGDEAKEAFTAIIEKYSGSQPKEEKHKKVIECTQTDIFVIDVEHITGKESTEYAKAKKL